VISYFLHPTGLTDDSTNTGILTRVVGIRFNQGFTQDNYEHIL